jgi:alpha-tubulin suppressor-like RCC1 family protein
LTVTNNGYGNTTPSGAVTVNNGASTAISATPNAGYHLTNWVKTDGTGTAVFGNANSANTTVTVTGGDVTIKAKFSINQYTLTIINNGYGNTTPSGAVTVNDGASTVIKATPKAGYHLTNWVKTAGTGTVVFGDPNSANTTVTVTDGNATIMAKFFPADFYASIQYQSYTCTSVFFTYNMGFCTGAYESWSSTNNGSFQSNCNQGDDIYGTNIDHTSIYAYDSSHVIVKWNPSSLISTICPNNGSATYSNYWYSRSLSYNGMVGYHSVGTIRKQIYIHVTQLRPLMTTLTFTNNGNGSTNPSGTVTVNQGRTTITATPNTGYQFINWTKANGTGNVVFDDANLANTTVSVTGGNATIQANFIPKVNLTVITDGHGSITPSDTTLVNQGENTIISASPNIYYHFVNWTQIAGSGTAVFGNANSASTTVSVTGGDVTICANFALEQYNLSIVDNKSGNTSLSGNLTVTHGIRTTITATSYTGYQFVKWTQLTSPGTVVFDDSNSASTTVTVTGGQATIMAYFSTPPLLNIESIAGGGDHSLALKNDGTVWAWGYNFSGQLGNGTNTDSKTPVTVNSLTNVIAIASEGNTSLALKNDGTVWAWGNNSSGQLGNGTTISSNIPVQVSNLTNIILIASGASHSLALKSDGTVWVWGSNSNGQLGNGTTTSSSIPVQVNNLTHVIAIASGGATSLALKNDGTVWAWGNNGYGQLGNCTYTGSTTPVQTSNLTNVIAIASGENHGLALKSDGTIWSWGWNVSGQLGNGTNTTSNFPVQVSNITNVIAINAGSSHNLALKNDGTVWGWGHNGYGQLGNGTTTSSSIPVQVSNLNNIITISAGRCHSLALKSDGTCWAWGDNGAGQFGNGTTTNSSIPVLESIAPTANQNILTIIIDINGSTIPSENIVVDNNVSESITAIPHLGHPFINWTQTDGPGTVVFDNSNSANTNVTVTGGNATIRANFLISFLQNINAITGGSDYSLALRNDGTLCAWGSNGNGKLGNGTTTDSIIPVPVSNLTGVIAIASGAGHNLALRNDGTVWAWGSNGYGQLGNGTTTSSIIPIQVSNLTSIIAIASGQNHSLALKSDGTVWTWGSNGYGELGIGTTTSSNIPVQVINLTSVISIAGGGDHTVALKSNGTVWTWGYNYNGELGNGTTTNSSIPVQVSNLSSVTIIASGGSHCLALKNDGTVWTWGSNAAGQLGNGTTTNSKIPVKVNILTNVTAINGGDYRSLALKSDGTAWSWGWNLMGQLGNGTTTNSSIPIQVSNLTNVITIASGYYHGLALKSDGTVWAWGDNSWGQLGNGTYTNSSIPVQVFEQ